MIPSKNRLKEKKEIERIFLQGKTVSEKFLAAKIANNKLGYSRFVFSVGLGFSKKAVERNKLKRILKNLLLENLEKIKTDLDVIFFIRKNEKVNLSAKSIRPIFEDLLRKNNLLKK
ncbi:MAG: ribonuclease P protein component [Candidatus Moranbacteria bacterium]|jgi:ribonuclease P protein component|nr:ribonuclease P protein component [Candidatus Moranbacteria bacterium]